MESRVKWGEWNLVRNIIWNSEGRMAYNTEIKEMSNLVRLESEDRERAEGISCTCLWHFGV